MADLSEKTKITLGFAGTLATILIVGVLAYSRLGNAESRLDKLETRVEVITQTTTAQDKKQALLELKLDGMNKTLEEISRDLKQLTSNDVRPVRGH
jgi:hypothetical protein